MVAKAVFVYSAQVDAEHSPMDEFTKFLAREAIKICDNGNINDYKLIGITMWVAEYIGNSYSIKYEDGKIIIEVPDYPLIAEERPFLQGKLRVLSDLAEVSFDYDFGCIDEERNVLSITFW